MFEYSKKELAREHKSYKKAVGFLDREFKKVFSEEGFSAWRDVKRAVGQMAARIGKQQGKMPPQMADVIAWRAFEEAIDHEPQQLCPILTGTVEDWWDEVEIHLAPVVHEAVNMCFDIGKGYSAKEAKRFHQQWLDEDEENRIYGDVYYAPDGSVVPIGQEVAEA